MADIRSFIKAHLLEPLKRYPTIIQETMLELITQKLQELYDYTRKFPEILAPEQSRLDILKTIADQFLFTVREEADIQEQVNILDNILYIYSRRGSIDTIENMWKYYGGSLPKGVKVVIPSYNLFRYSISSLSETDRYLNGSYTSILLESPVEIDIDSGKIIRTQDNIRKAVPMTSKGASSILMTNTTGLRIGDDLYLDDKFIGTIKDIPEFKVEERNSPGMYEIRLTNNTYPVTDLKEFMIKELVAAGNYIYFTNALHMSILSEEDTVSNPYKYLVNEDNLLHLQLSVLESQQGFSLSGYSPMSPNPDPYIYDNRFSAEDISQMTKYRNPMESVWSGRGSIFLELTHTIELPTDSLLMDTYKTYQDLGFLIISIPSMSDIKYSLIVEKRKTEVHINQLLYCTPSDLPFSVDRYLYNRENELIESRYPGYLVLGESLLGEYIINL